MLLLYQNNMMLPPLVVMGGGFGGNKHEFKKTFEDGQPLNKDDNIMLELIINAVTQGLL